MKSAVLPVVAVVVMCTLPLTRAGVPLAGAGVGGHAGVPSPTAFAGAAWYGRDSGAGGYAGSSLVAGLSSSGFASPQGSLSGNYLAGVPFLHAGQSAGFGGYGITQAAQGSHLSAYSG